MKKKLDKMKKFVYKENHGLRKNNGNFVRIEFESQ